MHQYPNLSYLCGQPYLERAKIKTPLARLAFLVLSKAAVFDFADNTVIFKLVLSLALA